MADDREIRTALGQILSYVAKNKARITQPVQTQVARMMQDSAQWLETRAKDVPLDRPLPQRAAMLWEISGRNPTAFAQYLDQYDDPSLTFLRRNPYLLQQAIQKLNEEYPKESRQKSAGGIPRANLTSANVWGFKQGRNGELVVRFNNGSVYKYDDVPRPVVNMLRQGAIPAKTTGQNQYGEWWEGKEPSVGAAFHELIKMSGYDFDKIK